MPAHHPLTLLYNPLEQKPVTFSSKFSSMEIWDFLFNNSIVGTLSSPFGLSWPSFNKNLLPSTLKMQMITKF